MQKNRIPDRCRGCRLLWQGGKADGVHDRWCIRFSNAAAKVQAQCQQAGGFEPKP